MIHGLLYENGQVGWGEESRVEEKKVFLFREFVLEKAFPKEQHYRSTKPARCDDM